MAAQHLILTVLEAQLRALQPNNRGGHSRPAARSAIAQGNEFGIHDFNRFLSLAGINLLHIKKFRCPQCDETNLAHLT